MDTHEINTSEALIKYIQSKDELLECMQKLNKDVATTYKNCVQSVLSENAEIPSCKFEIETVLDYLQDELNTGHWSEVPLFVRQAFSAASFIKTIILLKCSLDEQKNRLEKALTSIDMGLLLGAPLNENCNLLTETASYLSQQLHKIRNTIFKDTRIKEPESTSKRKHDDYIQLHYKKLQGEEIPILKCPSLECFNKLYFTPEKPVKLQDCMSHWPATKKWVDINYLLQVAGDRTVPIEIGSHYVDEGWSQKLMKLGDFFVKHYLSDFGDTGYLAQHNLFDQITELKDDICIPDYCGLSRNYENSCDPDVNAWLGPKGTVSPLHHDLKDNLLSQVYGEKQIILFSPEDTPKLYPHEGKLLFNTSQVDPTEPDLMKYPDFPKAKMYKCILGPSEILYIPRKWWHHVTALDKSFSVSFWWQ